MTAKGILSSQNGMNLYRGCSHGCIYCDSRSTCYQMDHAFEDVAVKVTGDAVRSFTIMFLQMWNVSEKGEEDYERYLQDIRFDAPSLP